MTTGHDVLQYMCKEGLGLAPRLMIMTNQSMCTSFVPDLWKVGSNGTPKFVVLDTDFIDVSAVELLRFWEAWGNPPVILQGKSSNQKLGNFTLKIPGAIVQHVA